MYITINKDLNKQWNLHKSFICFENFTYCTLESKRKKCFDHIMIIMINLVYSAIGADKGNATASPWILKFNKLDFLFL